MVDGLCPRGRVCWQRLGDEVKDSSKSFSSGGKRLMETPISTRQPLALSTIHVPGSHSPTLALPQALAPSLPDLEFMAHSGPVLIAHPASSLALLSPCCPLFSSTSTHDPEMDCHRPTGPGPPQPGSFLEQCLSRACCPGALGSVWKQPVPVTRCAHVLPCAFHIPSFM